MPSPQSSDRVLQTRGIELRFVRGSMPCGALSSRLKRRANGRNRGLRYVARILRAAVCEDNAITAVARTAVKSFPARTHPRNLFDKNSLLYIPGSAGRPNCLDSKAVRTTVFWNHARWQNRTHRYCFGCFQLAARAIELNISPQALERTLNKQLFTQDGRTTFAESPASACYAYAEDPKVTFNGDRIVVHVKAHAKLGTSLHGACLGVALNTEGDVSVFLMGKARRSGFAMRAWNT